MADDAKLIAVVEANTKAFENAMKRLEGVTKSSTDRMSSSVKKLDASFTGLGNKVNSFGKSFVAGFASSVSIGAIQQIIKATVAWGDALGDLADQTGISVKQIQILRYAAQQTGSSAEQMDAALKKFGVTLGQARTKGNDLKKILDANGISLTDMAGKARAPEAVLDDYIDLIGRLGDEQQKSAAIAAGFGKGNDELITTFRNGLGPIQQWADKLGDAGLVTEEQVKALGELDASFNDLSQRSMVAFANAVTAAIPLIKSLTDNIGNSVEEASDLATVLGLFARGDYAKALEFITTRGARRMTPEEKTRAEINRLEIRRGQLTAMSGRPGGREAAQAELTEISGRIQELYRQLDDVAKAPPSSAATPAVIPDLGKGGGGGKKKSAKSGMTTVTSKGGLKFTVDARYAEQFEGYINDLEAAGVDLTTGSSFRKGATVNGSGRPSPHSFAKAIDLNPALWKQAPASDPSRMIGNPPVELMRSLAAKWHMRWGGDFRRRDPMHVDVMGKAPMTEEELNAAKGMAIEAEKYTDAIEKGNEASLENANNLREAHDALTNINQAFKRDLLGGFIRDLEHGVKPAEALANALQKISDRLLDMALNAIFPDVGAGIIGAVTGLAGGGVMTSRGPMPLKRYAGGGVANSPQLAMFGEGSRPEAYVPLPDGRRIPVNIHGRGGGGVDHRVTVHPSPLFVTTTTAIARQGGRDAVVEASDGARRRAGGR